ncbi:uncharacterized protein SPPG_04937 [Spizellomyces punctatus DAOM BR117]|uniref:G-protein coupled receptors family 1 profile domain-containing protein n=1 Tax=Spizellomyces punctatus (strain DAOM BR117) TaxID=645134 RepID=A0A0L0HFI3_SPIPD|nr:uncharacterized protein SPPG_04937 [Spizellomyces punctatus DAOM BR117]KNC99548.1 hypothetical protein SPPG_04937 [Spizellomyces punctatus DAOM BR117]|eukprot:XP_016607588.1 hypothetical protein SPPG_04937 [Spizellomyces punctatus DAOM BR117]
MAVDWEPFTGYYAGSSAIVANDIEMFYGLHILSLVCITASFMGSSFVIITSVRARRYKTLNDRLPIYISTADLAFASVHFVDHLTVMVNKKYPSAGTCRLLGVILLIGWGYQITINGALAAQCWLKIVRRWKLPLGVYEWKLHALVMSIVMSIVVVGLGIDAFGPASYIICFKIEGRPGRIMWLLTVAFLIVTTVAIVFSSVSIRRQIRAVIGDVTKYTFADLQDNRTHQADVRMLNFAIIGCVQYIPTSALIFAVLFWDDGRLINKTLYYIALTTVNSGGTMNCLVYLHNQRMVRFYNEQFAARMGSRCSSQAPPERTLQRVVTARRYTESEGSDDAAHL